MLKRFLASKSLEEKQNSKLYKALGSGGILGKAVSSYAEHKRSSKSYKKKEAEEKKRIELEEALKKKALKKKNLSVDDILDLYTKA